MVIIHALGSFDVSTCFAVKESTPLRRAQGDHRLKTQIHPLDEDLFSARNKGHKGISSNEHWYSKQA